MSSQDLVDRKLVDWETRYQAAVQRSKNELISQYGQKGYEDIYALAQRRDDMATQAYHSWAALADQSTPDNPSDQTAYLLQLNEAKKRAIAQIPDAGVRGAVQKRIEGEMDDVLSAAVAFKALKDQFGMTYGSPEDAMQEFMHRPESMQGALGHVMGSFSDFRRFWDEIRPDVERLRQMNPGDDGAVEQAVAGSTLSKAMGMLLSDSTSRLTVKATTGGDPQGYAYQRFLKGLDEKDRAVAEGDPEGFSKYVQARALYIQGVASAEKMASEAANAKGTTYQQELKAMGAKLQALHQQLEEMRTSLPDLSKKDALWMPPGAEGLTKEPSRVGNFFRGLFRKSLDATMPTMLATDPRLVGLEKEGEAARALLAPRREEATHAGPTIAGKHLDFIPTNSQAWGEAVADLGISLVGFAAAEAAFPAKAVAGGGQILARAAQGAKIGGMGMMVQPGTVEEASRGDVKALAIRGLGGAGAGGLLGAGAGVAEKAIAPLKASRALTREATATSEAARTATPAGLGGRGTTSRIPERAPVKVETGPAPVVAKAEPSSPASTKPWLFTVTRPKGPNGPYRVVGKHGGEVVEGTFDSLPKVNAFKADVKSRAESETFKQEMSLGKSAPESQTPKPIPEAAKVDTPGAVTGAAPATVEAAPADELTRGAKAAISRSSNLAKKNTPATVRNLTLKDRIIEEARRVEPFRKEQRKLFTEERGRRASIIEKIGEEDPTEVGFFRQLEALKGELPKPDFGKPKITPNEFRQAIVTIQRSDKLALFEKLSAKKGFLAFREGYLPEPKQRDYLERVFGPEVVTAMEEKVFGIPHLGNKMSDVLGLTRGMKAMGDYTSMALRQGAYFAGRHPREWAQALGRSWKNAFSPKNQEAFNALIVKDPDYKLATRAGLNLPSIASKRAGRLSGREETFQNDIGEKLPWILGGVYRSSQRSAETFLTQLRLSVFKATKNGIDVNDEKALKALGDYINTFSGRASLGKYEQAGELLAKVGFAPRFSVSRLQAFNPLYYVNLPPSARRHALESALSFHASRAALLGLAASGAIPGVKVGLDRRSADFGKIIIGGKVRIDVYAGYQQIARTIDQLIEGQVKNSITGKVRKAGTKSGRGLRWQVLARFFQSRQHPVVGFIHDQLAEEDFVGRPIDTSPKATAQRAIEMYEPLIMQDMRELLQEKPELFPLLFPASQLGIGVQTYPLSKDKK